MPPKRKFTREEIISAALSLVREKGCEALTARALGAKLNSSPRPIFTVFDSMDEVRRETEIAADKIFNSYIAEGLKEKLGFKGSGKGYIRFARDEPKLFRMLFMTSDDTPAKLRDIFDYIDGTMEHVVNAAKNNFAVDAKTAQKLYHHLWIYSHGIAVLQATGLCDFSDDEIDEMLAVVGRSLYKELGSNKL